MPFFFFISGYLFKMEKYTSFVSLVKVKAKSILIPYVTFSILSVLIYSVIFDFHVTDVYSIVKSFVESKRNEIFYNVPLWFFTTLFLVEVLYFLIRKYIKIKWIILVILIVLGGIEAIEYNTTGQPKLSWSFDLGIYYMVFFGIGNLVSGVQLKNKFFIKQIVISLFFVINVCLLVAPEVFKEVNRIGFNHGSVYYLWSLIIGFAGISTFVLLSKYIKTCEPLAFLGRNTMIIFPLHFVLGYNLINVFVLVYKIPIVPSNITGFIYVGLELLILIPVVNVINKYFPIILGKSKKNENA